MTASPKEVYNDLWQFHKELCKKSQSARKEVIDKYKCNDIQASLFTELCLHDEIFVQNSDIRSCAEIDNEYTTTTTKKANIINEDSKENDEDPLHHLFANLYIFSKEPKTIASQNKKKMCLLINKWPWIILDNEWTGKNCNIYKIVGTIASEQTRIETNYQWYLNLDHTIYLTDLNISSEILCKTNDDQSNFVDELCFRFISNDRKYKQTLKKLQVNEENVKKLFVALKIGKIDNKTGRIKENCIYSYFDLKLHRKTDIVIPKEMYNYLYSVLSECKQRIKQLQDLNQKISLKRKHSEYTKRLVKFDEKKRSKRHKQKSDNSNAKAKDKNTNNNKSNHKSNNISKCNKPNEKNSNKNNNQTKIKNKNNNDKQQKDGILKFLCKHDEEKNIELPPNETETPNNPNNNNKIKNKTKKRKNSLELMPIAKRQKTESNSNSDNSDYVLMKKWLNNNCKLPQYLNNFMENGYESLDFVTDITNETQLSGINIKLPGHQTRIMAQIKKLNKDKEYESDDDVIQNITCTEQ
eukprot:425388_1